jgi:hypothetical protein
MNDQYSVKWRRAIEGTRTTLHGVIRSKDGHERGEEYIVLTPATVGTRRYFASSGAEVTGLDRDNEAAIDRIITLAEAPQGA